MKLYSVKQCKKTTIPRMPAVQGNRRGGGLHFHKASTGGVEKGKGGGRGGEGKSRRVTEKERCFFFR